MKRSAILSSLFAVSLLFSSQSVSASEEVAVPISSLDANVLNQETPIPLSLSDAYEVRIEKSNVKTDVSADVAAPKEIIPLSLSDAYEVQMGAPVFTGIKGTTAAKPVLNFYFKNIVVNQSYSVVQDKSFSVKGYSAGVKITKDQVVGNSREIVFYVTSSGQHTITLENSQEIRNLIYQTK